MRYDRYRGNSPQRKKRYWLAALLALLVAGVLAFAALEFVVYRGAKGQTAQDGGERQVMIIFGCQVKPYGPSALLQDRLETALDYWEEHPNIQIVVTGGKGDDEHMSEAQCMYEYLTAHGVDGEQITMEDKSRTTYQNIYNTINPENGIIPWNSPDCPDQFVLVSSDFHLTRILMMWERATGRLNNVTTLPAPCSHAPSRVKMFFREPLALVKSFLFDRNFEFNWGD